MDGPEQQLDGRLDDRRPFVERLAKVIFAGGAGVGKTCLLSRLFSDTFDANTSPTIGCDFQFKRYQVDNKSIGVTLWDTAGAERFSAMTSSYFRGAHGIILVFDVTRRDTLDALENHWLKEVEAYSTLPGAIKLVVGNKIDLANEREVTPEEGAAFARKHGCLYQEASAAAYSEDAHDALVWGLIVHIATDDELLKSSDHDKLQLEKKSSGRRRKKWLCC